MRARIVGDVAENDSRAVYVSNTKTRPSTSRDSSGVPPRAVRVCVESPTETAIARAIGTRARDDAMAKVPARLRSVTYTLSPMRTGVMHGLFKDWAAGMAKRVKENAVDAGVFCALPLGATVWCARDDGDARASDDAIDAPRDDAGETRERTRGGGGFDARGTADRGVGSRRRRTRVASDATRRGARGEASTGGCDARTRD